MKKEDKKEVKEKNVKGEKDPLIDIVFQLKEDLNELQMKNKEVFAGWQRTEADFLNYKNREFERLDELNFRIKKNILEGLLPVLDNFDLAEKAISEDEKKNNNIKGLLLIKKQLDYFLKSIGLEEILTIGMPFDSLTSEAIEEVDMGQEGVVVEEIQKGYKMNGRVIRPAKVKISR
ncbi:MAG: nucleotide exchange factor GrpE [Candidatus Paceibacterota bacterium]|jgi:molecular chaperone GrpE|nr:nucleotide exchange factor GrpE [bacterium]